MSFSAAAQTPAEITYRDPVTSAEIKLEAFVYEPKQANGKVVVFNHGSTGGKPQVIAETLRFLRIGKLATDNGYVMVTFKKYPQLDRKDGHETGTWRPDVWANDIFPWMNSLK